MKSVIKMDPKVKKTYIVLTGRNAAKIVSQAVLNEIFRYEISDAWFISANYKLGEDNIWRPVDW
jgi:hypothetical protein